MTEEEGDLSRLARSVAFEYWSEHPEVEAVKDQRWNTAAAWADDHEPVYVVHCTRCNRREVVRAFRTPVGVFVDFLARRSDRDGFDGYIDETGKERVVPAHMFGLLDPPADKFVPEPLQWFGDVFPVPWPATLPQPQTARARCPHGVHVIKLRTLVELVLAQHAASPVRHGYSTPSPPG